MSSDSPSDRLSGYALRDAFAEPQSLAANRLVAEILSHTVSVLLGQFPGIERPVIHDAVVDAILRLLAKPSLWDPQKAQLDTFVVRIAHNRVVDWLRANERRRRLEERAASTIPTVASDGSDEGALAELSDRLRSIATSTVESNFIEVWLSVKRSTDAYVRVLGIQDLPGGEQRREIKRVMERLRKRLRGVSRR
jgi:DNA-directed RNA polymerase specialized sigma24 family protein